VLYPGGLIAVEGLAVQGSLLSSICIGAGWR